MIDEKIKQKDKVHKKTGFTLVESLISITILMISVAAPLNLAGKGLVAADIAQRQIVAFYLAQDVTEAVINIKASNKLNNEEILVGLEECNVAVSPNGCYIDTLSVDASVIPIPGIETCSAGGTCANGKLYKAGSGSGEGLYRHNSGLGSDSGFTRYIKIEEIGSNVPVEEARITVTVWWMAGNGTTQSHTLVTNISNW